MPPRPPPEATTPSADGRPASRLLESPRRPKWQSDALGQAERSALGAGFSPDLALLCFLPPSVSRQAPPCLPPAASPSSLQNEGSIREHGAPGPALPGNGLPGRKASSSEHSNLTSRAGVPALQSEASRSRTPSRTNGTGGLPCVTPQRAAAADRLTLWSPTGHEIDRPVVRRSGTPAETLLSSSCHLYWSCSMPHCAECIHTLIMPTYANTYTHIQTHTYLCVLKYRRAVVQMYIPDTPERVTSWQQRQVFDFGHGWQSGGGLVLHVWVPVPYEYIRPDVIMHCGSSEGDCVVVPYRTALSAYRGCSRYRGRRLEGREQKEFDFDKRQLTEPPHKTMAPACPEVGGRHLDGRPLGSRLASEQ
ncbi:hypothetical protein CDD83_8749 [Cordyceps sp. RAO-2017]|nr:hypothetical protein CDD83_8749 [Cordyceps sp. RAO-2017]